MWQKVAAAYSANGRFYHTLTHIQHMFTIADQLQAVTTDFTAVQLAIWFHDAIYQLNAIDNEILSADLFMTLSESVIQPAIRQQVYQHIIATLHNGSQMLDHDSRYMVDIDLSSFGLPWEKFLQNSRHVREEMRHIPDEEFYPKQYRFQQSLLKHGRFYQTDYFFRNYEQSALNNIADYFVRLKKKTGLNIDTEADG